ncbi:diguanylate cyclase [uncultured Gammaproteobacteria bacterium]
MVIMGYERATELAAQAFERLAKERMLPTPDNYNLWYTYYAGHYPDLNRAIEQIVKSSQEFTSARTDDLIKRFFRFDAEATAVKKSGDQTQETIAKVLDVFLSAWEETGRYHRTLDKLRGDLDEPMAMEDLRAIVGEIVAESKLMADEFKRLKTGLEASSRQLTGVRDHLQVVRQEARIDSLTGVANRNAFEQVLIEAAEDSSRVVQPLSLLILDIDNFKIFNDSHGYLVGDQVLKLVARLLSQAVKEGGIPARYGGEEFAVIMPRTSLAEALTTAETIRNTLASKQISNRDGSNSYGRVTASFGVSQYKPEENLVKFIERAEKALSLAKKRGRNRVCAETEPGSSGKS